MDSLKNDRDLLAAQLSDAQSRAEHKAVVEAELADTNHKVDAMQAEYDALIKHYNQVGRSGP